MTSPTATHISIPAAIQVAEEYELDMLRRRDEFEKGSISYVVFDCCADTARAISRSIKIKADVEQLKEIVGKINDLKESA